MEHVGAAELEVGLAEIRRSPADEGTVELFVRRPAEGEREVLEEGTLDLEEGLVGDAVGVAIAYDERLLHGMAAAGIPTVTPR